MEISGPAAGDQTWPCSWLVERPHYLDCTAQAEGYECGQCEEGYRVIVDCGAPARALLDASGAEIGWTCDAGHEHVTAEARAAQGWDYAADAGEAYGLVRAGLQPRDMAGRIVTHPSQLEA